MNAFDDYLASWSGRIETALDRVLPPEGDPPSPLLAAMRYSVLAGGKRIRPALALLAARAAGGAEEEALPAACAVELVHSFSLVHDDLPAMDDDDLRRGRPSCHVAFGEATAILAGDGLLALAFEVLAGLKRTEVAAEAARTLAAAVGPFGLVGGQAEDLAAEGRPPDLATVERIHAGKTAALFVAAARLGGLSAGATPAVLASLGRFAEQAGRAFQIVDDVLDETGGDDAFGKTAGKDRAERKMTYPAAAGLEAARARAAELARRAAGEVRGLPGEEIFAALAARVVERTH